MDTWTNFTHISPSEDDLILGDDRLYISGDRKASSRSPSSNKMESFLIWPLAPLHDNTHNILLLKKQTILKF